MCFIGFLEQNTIHCPVQAVLHKRELADSFGLQDWILS